VISGIVVAAENEDIILEVNMRAFPIYLSFAYRAIAHIRIKAYWEAEHVAAQKEQEKRQQAVLKRWTKLVRGLRIRQRMREEYGAPSSSSTRHGVDAAVAVVVEDGTKHDEDGTMSVAGGGGGFLTGVEDVVQHYSLPRPVHVVFSSPPRSPQPDDIHSSPPPSEESPLPMLTTTMIASALTVAAPDMPLSSSDIGGEAWMRCLSSLMVVESVGWILVLVVGTVIGTGTGMGVSSGMKGIDIHPCP
jgi:hypothetical protein